MIYPARRCDQVPARHARAVYAQVRHTAGYNTAHTVELRLARCLLQARDPSGSNGLIPTQEAIAQTIGARRNSISLTLQQASCSRCSRGHIEIASLEGLRHSACERYGHVKARHDRPERRISSPDGREPAIGRR